MTLKRKDTVIAKARTWITKLPKVGIRPTIDGRYGGVRESLEDQVMGMAKTVAKLINENLKYPSGEPVECVIADSCIGTDGLEGADFRACQTYGSVYG